MKQTHHKRSIARLLAAVLAALTFVGACAQEDPSDGRSQDSGSDTPVADTGSDDDTGSPDTGQTDTGQTDTGVVDTGVEDTGLADVPVTGPRIRIATYNVLRLFDTLCDSGDCDRQSSFEAAPSQQDFEDRINQVAFGISRLDADVVLLQEIEKEWVLEQLNEALVAYGADYPVAVHGESGYNGSLDVAVLSKGTFVSSQGYRGQSTPFIREFLEVQVDLEGERVILFAAHFKSKHNDDPSLRLAEAREAREIVDAAAARVPDALVVFGGDLNDTPDSEPLQALTGNTGLWLTSRGESFDDYWTVYYDGRLAYDHLLVARNDGGRYLPGTILSKHNDSDGSGWFGSDHGALYAEFELY